MLFRRLRRASSLFPGRNALGVYQVCAQPNELRYAQQVVCFFILYSDTSLMGRIFRFERDIIHWVWAQPKNNTHPSTMYYIVALLYDYPKHHRKFATVQMIHIHRLHMKALEVFLN